MNGQNEFIRGDAIEAFPFRFKSIADLADALTQGEVSVEELASLTIRYLTAVGTPLRAIAALLERRTSDDVARAANALRHSPIDSSALRGVPFGVKDILDAVGAPTTWGCRYFRNRRAPADADAVALLSEAGAVLVAKLNTSELAGAGRAAAPGSSFFGQARNPWDASRFAGGSSSGPAVAVAIGAVPYALGSETAGSVVGPAAYSGVTGLRPTHGSISTAGMMLLSPTLDKVGVIARTAVDCGIVFDAISRSGSLSARGRSVNQPSLPDHPVRVAFVDKELDDCDEGTRGSLAQGVEEFFACGFVRVQVSIDRDLTFARALNTIMLCEATYAFREYLSDPDFSLTDAAQDAEFRTGARILAGDYLSARSVRDSAIGKWRDLFSDVDLVLSVSRPSTAPRLNQRRMPDSRVSDVVRATANLAGLPGMSFPCGIAGDGLPVGLHLVGPASQEHLAISAAVRFQRETGYHERIPTLIENALATGYASVS